MNPSHQNFQTTRWSSVIAAKGSCDESKLAFSELCDAYYRPVHAFIQFYRPGSESRDLTHAFFESVLEKESLQHVDPSQGKKFRSYLLGAVKHFLSDVQRKATAEKRGGQHTPEPLDQIAREEIPRTDPPDETYFDRQWAYTLLGRAMTQLSESIENPKLFEILKPWLNGDDPAGFTQADAAAQLGMTEGAVKVAIHRMRKKLRDYVRTEIAHTIESSDEGVGSAELDFLIRSLSES